MHFPKKTQSAITIERAFAAWLQLLCKTRRIQADILNYTHAESSTFALSSLLCICITILDSVVKLLSTLMYSLPETRYSSRVLALLATTWSSSSASEFLC